MTHVYAPKLLHSLLRHVSTEYRIKAVLLDRALTAPGFPASSADAGQASPAR